MNKLKEKINSKQQRKGISLIVLVITIIVIVVLATAVILSIANNNPIENAKEAKEANNESVLKETATLLYLDWFSDNSLGKTTETAEKYVKDKLKEQGYSTEELSKIKVTENGVTLNESVIKAFEEGLKIGDRVNYVVTSKTETSKSTENGYQDQSIANATNLEWRYIGLSDSGDLLITPYTVGGSDVTLKGAIGYLKGPDELDRLCNALYSTSKGEAKNMKIEDVCKLLGFTLPETWTMSSDDSLETPDGRDTSEYEFYSYLTTLYFGDGLIPKSQTNKMTYPDNVELVYLSSGTYSYFLSSSYVGEYDPGYVYDFGVHTVNDEAVGDYMDYLFKSYADESEVYNDKAKAPDAGAFDLPSVSATTAKLRPVVSLKADITKGTDDNGIIWNVE